MVLPSLERSNDVLDSHQPLCISRKYTPTYVMTHETSDGSNQGIASMLFRVLHLRTHKLKSLGMVREAHGIIFVDEWAVELHVNVQLRVCKYDMKHAGVVKPNRPPCSTK
jgi:hypothetical protein